MADKTLNQVFGEIADAIREKNGSESAIKPINMAQEIEAIPTGPADPGYYFYNANNEFIRFNEDGTECVWYLAPNGNQQVSLDTGWYKLTGESNMPDPYNFSNDLYFYDGSEFKSVELDSGAVYEYGGESEFKRLDENETKVLMLGTAGWEDANLSSGSAYMYTDASEHFALLDQGCIYTCASDGGWTGVEGSPYQMFILDQGWNVRRIYTDIEWENYSGLCYYEHDDDSYRFSPIELSSGSLYIYEGDSLHYVETRVDPTVATVCYYDAASRLITQINLNAGSVYTYEGDSTFTLYEAPSLEEGIWYANNYGEMSKLNNINSDDVYIYRGADEFELIQWTPNTEVRSILYYDSSHNTWKGEDFDPARWQDLTELTDEQCYRYSDGSGLISVQEGLYYFDNSNHDTWIKLSSGSAYVYNGAASFSPIAAGLIMYGINASETLITENAMKNMSVNDSQTFTIGDEQSGKYEIVVKRIL